LFVSQVQDVLMNQEPSSTWERYEGDFTRQPCLSSDLVQSHPDIYGDIHRK
jgi:hypothetical protein